MLTMTVEEFCKGTSQMIEKTLKEYRAACSSDGEFSKRMEEVIEPGAPFNIRQFYFDGNPAFFCEWQITGLKMTAFIETGYWRDKPKVRQHALL